MSGWLSRWRRQRTLERRPIPSRSGSCTLARFPFLAARSDEDLQALRDMTTLFPRPKEFRRRARARGQRRDGGGDRARRRACPALKLGLEWLDGFVGIVVHEDAVVASRQHEDEDGIVHAWDEELSGEAMSGGPVMLAWRDVEDAGESAADGYNVVVHEFAHVIDMRGGVTAGLESVDPASERGDWVERARRRIRAFADAVDAARRPSSIRTAPRRWRSSSRSPPRPSSSRPHELESRAARLYALLKTFFRRTRAKPCHCGRRPVP
jgi:Mlc titration factor MtfA (ptsG expression regulator)